MISRFRPAIMGWKAVDGPAAGAAMQVKRATAIREKRRSGAVNLALSFDRLGMLALSGCSRDQFARKLKGFL